jgi:hypothetical protein
MSQAYQTDSLTRPAAVVMVRHVATSDENSANSADITVAELDSVTEVFGVQIANSSDVRRSPQGGVSISGNVVTVADSGLAADEVITFTAVAVS